MISVTSETTNSKLKHQLVCFLEFQIPDMVGYTAGQFRFCLPRFKYALHSEECLNFITLLQSSSEAKGIYFMITQAKTKCRKHCWDFF